LLQLQLETFNGEGWERIGDLMSVQRGRMTLPPLIPPDAGEKG
jgi:hypothetical protein